MLDIRLIRDKQSEVEQALKKRMDQVDLTPIVKLDQEKRDIISEVEKLKAEKNKVSSEIPKLQKEKKDVKDLIEKMKGVASKIKEMDQTLLETEKKIQNMLDQLPNIPDEDVIAGDKENNEKVKEGGEKPNFNFNPKSHIELSESLGLVDYKQGAKLGGNGFWIYKGEGAMLEWALINYFIEEHRKDGYEFILPPHILTYPCGYTAGQFPKFEDDVFLLDSEAKSNPENRQFLLPTSETALASIYRDELLKEEDLPRKFCSFTPCYRKEGGGYRSDERGMIRGHQFHKVEMFQFTTPEKSEQAFEEILNKAENLVKGLGLHYQISKLAAKDCSASMAKTYDIEVWLPSINGYKEVSSVSKANDYQARRGNIRFKRAESKKNEFVHTLNGSGLATSRLFPAIIEHYQKADGTIEVPQVLRKWFNKDTISI